MRYFIVLILTTFTLACTDSEKYEKYEPDFFEEKPFDGAKGNPYSIAIKDIQGEIVENDTIYDESLPRLIRSVYDHLGRLDSTTHDLVPLNSQICLQKE